MRVWVAATAILSVLSGLSGVATADGLPVDTTDSLLPEASDGEPLAIPPSPPDLPPVPINPACITLVAVQEPPAETFVQPVQTEVENGIIIGLNVEGNGAFFTFLIRPAQCVEGEGPTSATPLGAPATPPPDAEWQSLLA